MLTRASLKNSYAVFAICMIVLVLRPDSLLSVRSESLSPKEIRDQAYFTVRQQAAVFLDRQQKFLRAHDRAGAI